MVRRRHRKDGFRLAETSVDRFETRHESFNGTGTHREVAAYFHIGFTPPARLDASLLFGVGGLAPQKRLGEFRTESPVNLPDAICGRCAPREPSIVNPRLHSDVGACLKLEISFSWLGAVVREECPLDVHWVRVVTLNEVAVVAVHRADESGKRAGYFGRQTLVEPSGGGDEF